MLHSPTVSVLKAMPWSTVSPSHPQFPSPTYFQVSRSIFVSSFQYHPGEHFQFFSSELIPLSSLPFLSVLISILRSWIMFLLCRQCFERPGVLGQRRIRGRPRHGGSPSTTVPLFYIDSDLVLFLKCHWVKR